MPFPRMSERSRRPQHRRLRYFTPTTNEDPRLPDSHRSHPAGHPKKYWCVCDGCSEAGEDGDVRPGGKRRPVNEEDDSPRILQSQGVVLDGHLRNCKYSPFFGWALLPWESAEKKEKRSKVGRSNAGQGEDENDDGADGQQRREEHRYTVEFDPSRPLGMWLEPISRTDGEGYAEGGEADRRVRGEVGEVAGGEATGTGCRVAGFDDEGEEGDEGYTSQARESGLIRVGDVVASVDGRDCLGTGGGGDGDAGEEEGNGRGGYDVEFGDVVRWLKEALGRKRREGGASDDDAAGEDGERPGGGETMIRIEFVRRSGEGTTGVAGDGTTGAEESSSPPPKKRRRGRPRKKKTSSLEGHGSPTRRSPRRRKKREKRSVDADGVGDDAEGDTSTPDITSVLSPCQVNHLRRRPCTCKLCGRDDGLPVCHFRRIPNRSNTSSGGIRTRRRRGRGEGNENGNENDDGRQEDDDHWWSTEEICVHPYCGTMAKMEPFSSPKYEIWSVAAIAANFGLVPGYAEAISMTRRVLPTSMTSGGGGGGGGDGGGGRATGARYCLLAEFHANLQWAAGPAFRPGASPPPVVDLTTVVAPPQSSLPAAVVAEGGHEAGLAAAAAAGSPGPAAAATSTSAPTNAGDELVRCAELNDAARGIDAAVLQNPPVAGTLNPAARERLERVVASMREEGRRILDAHPDNELSNFEQRFKLLVRYKIEKGDCLVPNLYENKPLRNFVNYHRTKFKNYSAGRTMVANDGWRRTYEREVELLNRVGFVWKAVEYKPWDDYFEELREFAAVHGHTRVPQIYKPNKSLAGWVHNQRKFYEQKFREGKKNCLTEEKIEKLDSIGFQWKLRHGRPKKSDPRYSYNRKTKADIAVEENQQEPSQEESDPADGANPHMESIPFQPLGDS